MKLTDLERQMRAQLQDHPTALDTAAFLERLRRRKRRRRWWLLFPLLALGLLSLLGTRLLLQSSSIGKASKPEAHRSPEPSTKSSPTTALAPLPTAPLRPLPHPAARSPRTRSQSLPTTKHQRPSTLAATTPPTSDVSRSALPIGKLLPLARAKRRPLPLLPQPDERETLKITPVTRRTAPRFFLQVEAGLVHAQRQLTAPDAESQVYLDLRQRSETPLEAWQIGLMGRWQWTRWHFRWGLSYTRATERFQYAFQQRSIEPISGVREILLAPNGDSLRVTDEVLATITRRSQRRVYNHLELFDLPFILGYRISSYPLDLRVEAGVLLNWRLRTSGEILAPDLGYQPLDEGIFRSQLGWTYYSGLQLSYQMTPHLIVDTGPSMRIFPQHFSDHAAPLRQSYWHWNWQLSLRFALY